MPIVTADVNYSELFCVYLQPKIPFCRKLFYNIILSQFFGFFAGCNQSGY